MRSLSIATSFALLAACSPPPAEAPARTETPAPTSISVTMNGASDSGVGEALGTVEITQGAGGAVFALSLHSLPAGVHGFHVHETADCSAAMTNGAMTPAGAAGGHWDPQTTGHHAGPDGDGHLGDLPRIEAGADGAVTTSVTAPRITDIAQLHGHALMIHGGGDNYSDTPAPLGGGGPRIACGVIS